MRKKEKVPGFLLRLFCLIFLGAALAGRPTAVLADSAFKQVSLGGFHTAGLKWDGSLWMWGNNGDGELGAENLSFHVAAPVQFLTGIKSAELGNGHSAVIKKDGSLWVWGWDTSLGYGIGDDQGWAKPVKILDNVVSVSIGRSHGAAVKKDGTLWVWGSNEYGQLGTGDYKYRNTPVRVLANVVSVSAGTAHTAVIKKDGSLWTWGGNWAGQLGNGTKEKASNKPVKVLTDVASAEAGLEQSAAVKKDGTLWVWGSNNYGELGMGNTAEYLSPVQAASNVASVSLGEGYWEGQNPNWKGSHMAVLKKDGTLWMCGANQYGQLGIGKISWKNPDLTEVMTDVESVSLGGYYSAAIKRDGSLWTWGQNFDGQLGTGDMENRNRPVKISSVVKTDLKDCTIKLSFSSAVYSGKRIKPAVTVKVDSVVLKQGTDYSLSYSDNIKPGTAVVTVNGKGNYTGTASKNFKIVLEAPKITEAVSAGYRSIKVAWNAVPGAEKYRLYYKGGGLTSWKIAKRGISGTSFTFASDALLTGTEYTFTVRGVSGGTLGRFDPAGAKAAPMLGQVKITDVSAEEEGLRIAWEVTEGASGYQIWRKEGVDWVKKITIRRNAASAYLDTSAEKGKTYSYRIRAFRVVEKKNVFGDYSDIVVRKMK